MSRTHQHSTRPRTTRRLAAALGFAAASILGVASASVLGSASPALAHDELVGTEVVADASNNSPEAVRLTFSNSIIEVGTEIVITDAQGADVTAGDPEISGPDVTQPLAADLPGGAYNAEWRVVSSDGHPIEGAFGITVAEDGTATIEDAATPEEGAEHEGAEQDRAEHSHEADGHEDGAAEEDAEGVPAGAMVAIAAGAAVLVAGAVAAVLVGQRRRARAMNGEQDEERRS